MKIAAILLNRNLPYVTNKLYHSLKKNNKNLIDVFIVDAGSDNKKYQNTLLGKLILNQ